MAHDGKRGWLPALGMLLLLAAPAAAGPADKPGIDGRIPEPPRCSVLRDVLWPPSNRFVDIQFHAQTEPDNRIFTFIYSNTFPSRRGDALTGWNASLSLRAALKRRGPTYPPEPRVYLIVVAANSPMGGWSYSTCTVVVPVNPGLTALEEARAKARAAEHWFHEIGAVPDGYYPVLESNSLESLPTVTIAASDATARETKVVEPPDTGRFTVTRDGDLSSELSVSFWRSGTATSSDYQELISSVTILADSASADIHIYPSDDGQVEGSETLTLQLVASENDPYTVGDPGQATVNIEDNDVPATVTITASNTPETIGNSGAFTITRDGDLTWPVKVYHQGFGGTAGSGDYTVDFFGSWGPDYWEIPAGEPSITIYILPVDDTEIEGPETVIHTLSANSQYELGTSSATVTIEDDEVPPLVTIAGANVSASENVATYGPYPGTFRVTRTGDLSQPLTVSYTVGGSATPGADYPALPGTLEIPAEQATAEITFTPVNDGTPEGEETVVVTLTDGSLYDLDSPSEATVRIDDSSPVASVIVNQDSAEGSSSPGLFAVVLQVHAPSDLTLNYTISGSAAPGSDYTTLSGTVTILAGDSTAVIEVSSVDDSFVEENETVTVTLTEGSGFTLARSPVATLTIVDNDLGLSGTVKKAGTLEAISGAEVQAVLQTEFGEEVRATTTSGEDGFYSFSGLESGDYIVKAAKSGYYDGLKPVTLAPAQSQTGVNLLLDPWGLRVTATKSVICAGGRNNDVHQTTIIATLTDETTGELRTGVPIVFSTTEGTLSEVSTETDVNGQATAVLTSSGISDTPPFIIPATVTVSTDEGEASRTGSVNVEFHPASVEVEGDPNELLTEEPGEGFPGESSLITVKLTLNGEPVPEHNVKWRISRVWDEMGNLIYDADSNPGSPPAEYGTLAPTFTTTDEFGQSSVTLTAGTVKGRVRVEATDRGERGEQP